MTRVGAISGAGTDASDSVDIGLGWAGLSWATLSWVLGWAGLGFGGYGSVGRLCSNLLGGPLAGRLGGASPPLDGSAVAFLAVRLAARLL